MTGTSPERGDTSVHTRFMIPFRGIMDAGVRVVNYFREWYEEGQVEKRSRRYVDSLFECFKTGAITEGQVRESLSLDNEKIASLRLSRYEVNSHAISRILRLRMCGY